MDSPDAGEPLPELQTVVTATRDPRPRATLPFTVIVIPADELERSPSLTLDSVLRSEPSAATFRRNSSLVADPTAQGVNLRGVGPSGVSRALVLLDGLPVNDPFGGWVFWRSLPRLGLERIELVPGPGSALYGSSALGGVVQLISRAPTASTLEAEMSGGNLGTFQAAARAAHVWEHGAATLEGGVLRSDGHPLLAPDRRGPVDGRANGDDVNLSARVEVRPQDDTRIGMRLSYFAQRQNGGTAFTSSNVQLLSAGATWDWSAPTGGHLQASLFLRSGQFDQRRARINADRTIESLAGQQQVPLADQGGAVLYHFSRFRLLGLHSVSVGLDVRRATGDSHEVLFPPGGRAIERSAGGEQQFGGVFVQDTVSLGEHVELVGSVRADGWRNLGGRSSGAVFPERQEGQVSPRAGILWRPFQWLSLRTSAGTGFRAPTLNELYRPFQVGTILTAANEALVAERLVGAEAGVELSPVDGFVSRLTVFWNRLENPVTNVTLPSGAGRQRQNLGAAQIQGLEASVHARFLRRWTGLVAYSFVDARVVSAGPTGLEGKRLAQDPQHRGSASLTFDHPSILTATAEVRVTGPQFEDDLNALELGGFVVVNVSVSRRLWRGLEVFGAIENLLDRRYVVGRAGVDTYGQPLMGRVGLRLR